MTVPCTSCGEALTPDDLRCPTCGTLAPPRPGASVFAPEGPAPRWAPHPGDPGDPVDPQDETMVEPWSIPIRESPRPAEPVGAGPSDSMRAVTYGVVVVAVLVAVVALASSVLGSGDDDVASGGDSPVTESDEDAEVLGDVEAGDVTTTSSAPSTTTSTSTTTTSTTTTTPTTTTAAVARASSGTVPALPSSFRRGWVAQLSSVPASAGSSALEASWDRVKADVPGAVAARSDDWPSLSPGYWVLVAPGPFGSEDDVRAFCSSAGRSSDSCLPRMLTDRR